MGALISGVFKGVGGLFGIGGEQQQRAPEIQEVKQPTVNQEVVDRNAADIMRRRRGAAATVVGASNQGSTAGAVASKTLLGQ